MTFDNQAVEIPQTLLMLPIRDIIVFPYMIIPLFVGRESSIRSVEEALSKNRLIFLASQKDIAEENPSPNSIYEIGTIAKIMRMRKLSDGRVSRSDGRRTRASRRGVLAQEPTAAWKRSFPDPARHRTLPQRSDRRG